MTLFELAFGCFVYAGLTDFDKSYTDFLQRTQGSPDLMNPEHREALLEWLRRWGCRQFARDYHEEASREILSWYQEHGTTLAPADKNLWELTEDELVSTALAYGELSSRTACWRTRGRNTYAVKVGPAGAAKTLFAIRPLALPPWDEAIRAALGYDGTAISYLSFLESVRTTLQDLEASCQKHGFELAALPDRLGSTMSSVPKLIDEYYWITKAKKCTAPDQNTLQRWLDWNQL